METEKKNEQTITVSETGGLDLLITNKHETISKHYDNISLLIEENPNGFDYVSTMVFKKTVKAIVKQMLDNGTLMHFRLNGNEFTVPYFYPDILDFINCDLIHKVNIKNTRLDHDAREARKTTEGLDLTEVTRKGIATFIPLYMNIDILNMEVKVYTYISFYFKGKYYKSEELIESLYSLNPLFAESPPFGKFLLNNQKDTDTFMLIYFNTWSDIVVDKFISLAVSTNNGLDTNIRFII